MDISLNDVVSIVQQSEAAFCRFITANDTGKNGSHQAGFYIPKCASALLFDTPGRKGENKDRMVEIRWQNDFVTQSRFIYYGQKTRNEYRITRFGKDFPFFEEDNVGDLLVIARCSSDYYQGFVLKNDQDIEDFFAYFNLSSELTNQLIDLTQTTGQEEVMQREIDAVVNTFSSFPETRQMADLARHLYNKVYAVSNANIRNSPDKFLLRWNEVEFSLFKAFEEKLYSPVYTCPFKSCQSLVDFSNSILNRRKSRAGKSLEHHLAHIFTLSDLKFETQVVTEDNKKPDFIFPSGEAYHNLLFPADDLVFLGVKTTCKDRWRQVLNEADRIDVKYLFTLQQGISKNQLKEMKHEGVKLVVPKTYLNSFDREYQSEMETLSSFVGLVKEKQKNL